ncbi:MAG: hypothetical protein L0Y79_12865 [Chlorobi bacterium]|nr:hypothetical protein [Chlorobiota bacterium]MCI0716740.1 hypothetical protein [Chlorobiota bacterium]
MPEFHCRPYTGKSSKRWINERRNYSFTEILLYNMRHVQHHTGQLNFLLGQINHDLPVWVSQTKIDLKKT